MRFRVRGKLPTGQPIIAKPDTTDAFSAAAQAGQAFRAAGHDVSTIRDVTVKAMKGASNSVYIGKVPTKRAKPASPKAAAPAEKPAAAPAHAPKGATTAKK